tara:strand:- start:4005 stop:4718 length:714 start_codon:yes stop_codon:yes gene_type:complete
MDLSRSIRLFAYPSDEKDRLLDGYVMLNRVGYISGQAQIIPQWPRQTSTIAQGEPSATSGDLESLANTEEVSPGVTSTRPILNSELSPIDAAEVHCSADVNWPIVSKFTRLLTSTFADIVKIHVTVGAHAPREYTVFVSCKCCGIYFGGQEKGSQLLPASQQAFAKLRYSLPGTVNFHFLSEISSVCALCFCHFNVISNFKCRCRYRLGGRAGRPHLKHIHAPRHYCKAIATAAFKF